MDLQMTVEEATRYANEANGMSLPVPTVRILPPLRLAQNTALGREKGETRTYFGAEDPEYGFPCWSRTPLVSMGGTFVLPAEFSCAVTLPAFMVGDQDSLNEEIRDALDGHYATVNV